MKEPFIFKAFFLLFFLLPPFVEAAAQSVSILVSEQTSLPISTDLPHDALPLHEAGKTCLEEEE